MIYLRSFIFMIAFFLCNALLFIVLLPSFLLPFRYFMRVPRIWAGILLWLNKVICGVTVEVRGRENFTSSGALYAVKHQSVWDILFMVTQVPYPTFIMKRELLYVPLFGWYLMKSRQIPIDRSRGTEARRKIRQAAKRALEGGQQMLIYPEGTRRPVGAPRNYKYGVAFLYEDLGAAVHPVAHNAGIVWPRRTFMKYPGKVIVEFLPPIPAGLPKDEFFERLVSSIEDASDRLAAEGGFVKP